jgi:uncharacterized protein (DUF952 family)
MEIYKVFRTSEWDNLVSEGSTLGAPVDLADGFIHFSTAGQLRETLRKHFTGAGDLVLAAIEADRLGPELRWEPSRGGALFPHLYRALARDEVVWTAALHETAQGHALPEGRQWP